VVFLGEGWNGFYSGGSTDYNGDATKGADQSASAVFKGQNIAMFSDSYRDTFKKGGLSEGSAFLSGTAQGPANLFSNIAGVPTNSNVTFAPGSTHNVVSYLTCHDNLCLYDALVLGSNALKTTFDDGVILKRAKVGYAALLTSQGMAFIHAGDEMFRTKETTAAGSNTAAAANGRIFVHNSYNASDAINMVKWANVYSGDPIAGGFTNYATTSNGYQLYSYVQGLTAIRKSSNAFRLPDANRAANLTYLPPVGVASTTLAFGYKCLATDLTAYYVFHNADPLAKTFTADVDLSGATLLADGFKAGLTPITTPTGVSVTGSSVTLQPFTSAIIRKP
jgi:pullulanase/glycogen debranching enzyme